jgi:hypothetical protein
MATLEASALFTRADAGPGAGDFAGSLTISGGLSDSILVIKLNCNSTSGHPSAVRLGGSGGPDLTAIGTTQSQGTRRNMRIWYLLNPTADTYTAIHVIAGYAFGGLVAEVWSGVDQSTPFHDQGAGALTVQQTNEGGFTTLVVDSPTDGVVIDGIGFANATPTVGSGQTATELGTSPGNTVPAASGSYEADTGSIDMDWGGVNDSAHVGAALVPAAGGAAAGSVTRKIVAVVGAP